MNMLRSAAIAALLWANPSTKVFAAPSGFDDRRVVNGDLGFPTDFTWTPDGKMIVAMKSGLVIAFDDPNGDNTYPKRKVALDLTPVICDNSERGLEGLALHPKFGEENRYIYLYYTFNKHGNCDEDPFIGPCNRLSRFEMSESGTIDEKSELPLFDTTSLEYDHHNSGDIEFGKDGNIYVTVGDGGSTFSRVSQSPSNLLGSIIRLTDDGGIPEDNPYFSDFDGVRCNKNGVPPDGSPEGAKCQEIFAIGLRNPFRFAMDPNTDDDEVRFFINDVGQSKWEEISEGGTKFVGANYGWPEREGPCKSSTYKNCDDKHGFQDPFYYYLHTDDTGEGAVTGGAFVPKGVWPSSYDGAYLFADYVYDKVYVLKDNGKKECRSCDPPESRKDTSVFTTYKNIMTMKFGPYDDTQALYYSSWKDDGTIRRVSYAGDGNRLPQAVIEASRSSGPVDMKVQFNGAESTDQDGDKLRYEWDFDGDGKVDSTSQQGSFRYSKRGVYDVKLKIRDEEGATSTASVEISVGSPPKPVIKSPGKGATFAVGDIITLEASEENEEAKGITFTWEVRQHHASHFHPFLKPTKGNNFKIKPAPAPEDYDAATNSYLGIILTATDRDGLSTTVTRNVQPRMVQVEFDTEPSGLEIFLDGSRLVTPAVATTWENHQLQVEARDQTLKNQAYTWDKWSDGKGQAHKILIPKKTDKRPQFVAEFDRYSGTFPPTPSPYASAVCLPGYLGLTAKEAPLETNDYYENKDFGVFLFMQDDGNLLLRRGTVKDPKDILWESGPQGKKGDYLTTLQGDSNWLIKAGTPKNSETKWATKTFGIEGDYFLGIDCTGRTIAVYEGRTNNPGKAVWSAKLKKRAKPKEPVSPSRPAPKPGAACKPVALIRSSQTIKQNQDIQRGKFFVRQQGDGNLVVRRGTPEKRGSVVWSSGFVKQDENIEYYTRMQGDAHIITRTSKGDSIGWQSYTAFDPDKDYFLGVDCDGKKVSIYEEKTGKILFTFDDDEKPKPPPISSGACEPVALLVHGETIGPDEVIQGPDVYLKQQRDGNVVLRKGTPEKRGEILWATGYYDKKIQDYSTKLQGDANFVTKSEDGVTKWKTDKLSDSSQEYFLGLNCDNSLSIYQGTQAKRGKEIWSSESGNDDKSKPPPIASSSCKPNLLLEKDQTIEGDQVIQRGSVFIKQQRDGNLIVRQGTPEQRGEVLWASGLASSIKDYYSKIQGDGNMLTWEGSPSEKGNARWRTGTTGSGDEFFLALNCDGKSVSIYQGTPDNPGKEIWSSGGAIVSASSSCKPGALMSSGDTILKDESIVNKNIDAYIRQQGDGNLVVYLGTPDKRGELVWASGSVGSDSKKYHSKLQGDGHLLTREGLTVRGKTIFRSNSNGEDTDYFLALNCDRRSISIYKGTEDKPGEEVWTSAVQ